VHVSNQQSWQLFRTYLTPQRQRVGVLSILLLGSIALQLVNPQVLRNFLDTVQSGASRRYLVTVAALFMVVALAQQALSLAATYLGERLAWTATNELRSDLALHCLHLDLGFHKAHTPGELIERIDGDVTAMANFFSQFVVQIVGNLLLLMGVLVALWFEDWRAGLTLSVFALVTLGVMLRLRALAVPHWRAARQASAELFGFLEERLGGTEDIRSSGAVAYVMRRLFERTRERYRTTCRARLVSSFGWAIPIVLMAIGTALSLLLAGYLYQRGIVAIGGAFLLYYYTRLLFQPLNVISFQLDDFQKASAGMARVQELLGTSSTLVDGPAACSIPDGPLGVEFRDVSFSYEDALVLQGLSFQVRPGAVLGVLGRTGSGKTTIVRLLFRLYDPTQGRILLAGTNLRDLHRSQLRTRVGMVTQDVQLFRATVRDNLTFFDDALDDRRLLAAIEELGLASWYRSLPHGLDTMLEAGGGGLSAGEAQLLAFTRVFLHDPGLVILDEASSRLDPHTERLIDQAIEKLLRGRTAIIIAHRLHTVTRADEILILDGGCIQEYGPREDLARDLHSRFSQLVQAATAEAEHLLT